jgi:iron complex transport system substrate-binding protein
VIFLSRRAWRSGCLRLAVFPFIGLILFPSAAFPYDRIISFRPNVTEILFALDLGPRVVGVTTFCRYPPEAEKIEKIGGYFNRNLERILSLKPDLVVLVPDTTTPKIESALKRSGVEVLVVKADTLEDVEGSIRAIAAKTGVPARGEALVSRMRREMGVLKHSIKNRPGKKTVLVLQRRPLVVAGGGTFLDSLLKLAGAENIAGGSSLPYPHFSLETLLSRAPEVIIDLDPSDAGDYWSRYPSIPAVKNGDVVSLSPDLFVPSPRMTEALKVLIEKMAQSDRTRAP